jgi:predicted Zn-dependent protease
MKSLGQIMRKDFCAAVLCGLFALVPVAPACADEITDDVMACHHTHDPNQGIRDCTALLTSVHWVGNKAAWVYAARGAHYMDAKNYDAALADLTQAISMNPDYADAHFNRAQIYLGGAQWDLAKQDLDAAILLDPVPSKVLGQGNHKDDEKIGTTKNIALASRAMAEIALHDAASAVADADAAVTIEPDNAWIETTGCAAHVAKGDFSVAIADCSHSLDLSPNGARALYLRGLAKLKSGDAGGGNADIAAAKAIEPNIAAFYAPYGLTP